MSEVLEPGEGRPLEAFKEIRPRENYEVNGSALEAVLRAQAQSRSAGETTSVSSSVSGDWPYQYSNIDVRLIRVNSKRLVVEFMSPWAEGVDTVELPDTLVQTNGKTEETSGEGSIPAYFREVGPRKTWPDDTDPKVLEALRLSIGRLLFPGEYIQGCYRICENRLTDNDGLGLRLRLFIYDPVIAAIPWESALIRESYIGRRERLPVIRYVIGEGATRFAKFPQPLQFLGVVCHPNNTQDIDALKEKELIEKALAKLQEASVLECKWLVQIGSSDLDEELSRKQYHIFHFIGHGEYDSMTKKGALLFCDKDCNPDPLSVDTLVEIISERRVQFACLNACDSGHEAGGIAETLVRRVLPAAIGMRRAVRDDAAIDFAQHFYQALGDHLPVDAALSRARKKLSLKSKSQSQWALPILYMRAGDGKVL